MSDLKLSFFLLTAPFVLLATLAELGLDLARYREVRDFGQSATAIVRSIEPASFLSRPEGGAVVAYALDLPGPAVIDGAVHLSDDDAARYSPGQEIEIVYATSDASLHALSVGHAWVELVNTAIVVGAYCAVLALAFALLRASPYKSWRDAR
ncbi:hypothetical protein [Hyphomicrobium sp. CS1GBMeth3]|uniref:hypothetical protein n=1 Tax=Hyphomicrobium sp. CS1GBMeth3 TaxID=1892845 RepID=UPI000930623B|nr:hypothetical protein [Hyphomicrobium sp. CS1GBMeth3]